MKLYRNLPVSSDEYYRNASLFDAIQGQILLFPCWQRAFVWKTENFKDFWRTLSIAREIGLTQNLGTISFYKKGTDADTRMDVVGVADGQERIMCLSILIATLNELASEKCEDLRLPLPSVRIEIAKLSQNYSDMADKSIFVGYFAEGHRFFRSRMLQMNAAQLEEIAVAIQLLSVHIDVLPDEGAGFDRFMNCNSAGMIMSIEDVVRAIIENRVDIFGLRTRYDAAIDAACGENDAKNVYDMMTLYYGFCERVARSWAKKNTFNSGFIAQWTAKNIAGSKDRISAFIGFVERIAVARKSDFYRIAVEAKRSYLIDLVQFYYALGTDVDESKNAQEVFYSAYALSYFPQVHGKRSNGTVESCLERVIRSVLTKESARKTKKAVAEMIQENDVFFQISFDTWRETMETSGQPSGAKSLNLILYRLLNGKLGDVTISSFLPNRMNSEWSADLDVKLLKNDLGAYFVTATKPLNGITLDDRYQAIKAAMKADQCDAKMQIKANYSTDPAGAIRERTDELMDLLFKAANQLDRLTSEGADGGRRDQETEALLQEIVDGIRENVNDVLDSPVGVSIDELNVFVTNLPFEE